MSARHGLLVLAAALGCSSARVVGAAGADTLVPRGRASVFGEVVRVRSDAVVVVGELLACDGDGLYLRVHTDRTRWVQLDRRDWHTLEVDGSQNYLAAGLWSGAGALSTLTHGWFLVISAPIWAVTGAISTATAGPRSEVLDACSMEVRSHARWPQGLPEGLRERFVLAGPDLRMRERPGAAPVPAWRVEPGAPPATSAAPPPAAAPPAAPWSQ